jgi:RNA polymerase sigma factor (sigma-70 family)
MNQNPSADLDPERFKVLFEQFYKNHRKDFRKYAYFILKDWDLSKDIVHIVFTYLWTNIERLGREKLTAPYVRKCIHHACISHLRDNKKLPTISDQLLKPTSVLALASPSQEQKIVDAEYYAQLYEYVERLEFTLKQTIERR